MAKPDKNSKKAEAADEADAPTPTTEDAPDLQVPTAGSPLAAFAGAAVGLIAIVVFALPTVIVVAVGMVPSVVAALLPTEKRRRVAPVAMMNLAGIASVLGTLWRQDNSVGGALMALSSPISWLVILGAVGLGMALRTIFPNIAASLMERSAENRLRQFRADQKDLVVEWSAEVRSTPPAAGKTGTTRATKPATRAAPAQQTAPKTRAKA